MRRITISPTGRQSQRFIPSSVQSRAGFFKRDPSNPSTFSFPWGDSDIVSSHSYYLSREIWTNNSINNIIGSNRDQRWNNQEEVGWSQLIAELKVYESTCSWHESVIQAVGNHLYVQGEEGE